ncbi:MAG TPA: diadenylate cyclase CdaA [Candidatus Limnocylindria bacterium]|jgi:diadenylate cyclase|nr:diadenylate cyclase CdaA [Candidatus Limnocylindria bacterium]
MNNVLQIVEALWRPTLEIMILAVGIYLLYTFLRGTRGAAIVTGFVFILLALTLTVRLLHLEVLNSLLNQFLPFLALSVIILFHPELRRLLAEIGNLPLFSSTQEQRENLEVIVQSVDRLSPVRIGALIAIEQGIQLVDLVEAGIAVDCEATPEMLETIFFPNNAIHDGGVIIRGDRILRAGTIFPLTRRHDLPKSLGTRHRAAIGLTEETDAVVVVVSEETGAISYAHKGVLTRSVSVEELRAFLTQVLVRKAPAKTTLSWLRDWLRVGMAKPLR